MWVIFLMHTFIYRANDNFGYSKDPGKVISELLIDTYQKYSLYVWIIDILLAIYD